MEQTLREKRIQNVIDAVNFREPEKVPVGIQMLSWPFAREGVTFEELKEDSRAAVERYMGVVDELELDFTICDAFSYDPVYSFRTLGNNSFDYAPGSLGVRHNQACIHTMDVEDYELLIRDPARFHNEIFPRYHFPAFQENREDAYRKLKEAAVLYKPVHEANCLISQAYRDRQIITLGGSPLFYRTPLSNLFDLYRGIQNAFSDLRRHKNKVDTLCEILLNGVKEGVKNLKPEDVAYSYPLGLTAFTCECLFNKKQFDKYYFDPFKEIFTPYLEAGAKIYLRGEGSFIHFLDRYRELPKGSVVIMVDDDDPFAVHEKIGDWMPLATGIKVNLLQSGTKQECVDYVKKCFDVLAPGGGFIFTLNKTLLYANDVRMENLAAAYETANELSRG